MACTVPCFKTKLRCKCYKASDLSSATAMKEHPESEDLDKQSIGSSKGFLKYSITATHVYGR